MALTGTKPNQAHQVAAGLSTSSLTEKTQGSPLKGTGPKGRKQNQRPSLFSLLGTYMMTKMYTCYICVGGLCPCWLFGWWFCLCEPTVPIFVYSAGLLVQSLTPPPP